MRIFICLRMNPLMICSLGSPKSLTVYLLKVTRLIMIKKIRKVIRALPKSWEVKATTLKELNDREEMDFSGFISNLKTHEMEMKMREEREAPTKRAIAFKVTPSSFDEEESSEDYD